MRVRIVCPIPEILKTRSGFCRWRSLNSAIWELFCEYLNHCHLTHWNFWIFIYQRTFVSTRCRSSEALHYRNSGTRNLSRQILIYSCVMICPTVEFRRCWKTTKWGTSRSCVEIVFFTPTFQKWNHFGALIGLYDSESHIIGGRLVLYKHLWHPLGACIRKIKSIVTITRFWYNRKTLNYYHMAVNWKYHSTSGISFVIALLWCWYYCVVLSCPCITNR